jgi:hypothetical protein
VTLTAHRPGCGFIEDLLERADAESGPPPQPEPGPATRALAATYERYAEDLAAIEAVRNART